LDEHNNIVIKEHNSCKYSVTKPKLLICGVLALCELLKKTHNTRQKSIYDKSTRKTLTVSHEYDPVDYVIFIDENTVTMDYKTSPMVPYLQQIYLNLPPCTIFSSATHPNIEELPELVDYVKSKYPNAAFKTISKSKILIGTQLNNIDGHMFIPHFGCETPEQLERFIDLVQEKLIFKKFYTLPIIQDMFKQLQQINIVVPENIQFKNFMDDYGHRNQESIQNLAIEYLKLVLDTSRIQNQPELVKKICNMNVINKPINLDDFVKLSTQFDGQTFISCTNPLELMHFKFDLHIEKIKDELKVRSFQDLYNKYLRTIEETTKRVESLQKSGTKTSHSNKEMSKLDYERMYAEMSEHVEIPKIPSNLLLGSSKSQLVSLSIVNWNEIEASDFEKFMMLLGVVFYSTSSHHTYHNLVVDIISNGRAVFVFTDSSLNYGNSFPFNNGIIMDDMASIHSFKSFSQLMARAGRPGVSDCAIIYAGNKILQIMSEPIHNPNFIDIEHINLNRAIQGAIQIEQHKIEEEQKALHDAQEKTELEAFEKIRAKEREETLALTQAKLAKEKADNELSEKILLVKKEIEPYKNINIEPQNLGINNIQLNNSEDSNKYKNTSKLISNKWAKIFK